MNHSPRSRIARRLAAVAIALGSAVAGTSLAAQPAQAGTNPARHLFVRLGRITVTNDGDTFGSGEMYGGYMFTYPNTKYWTNPEQWDVSDGGYRNDRSVYYDNEYVITNVKLQVELLDWDGPYGTSPCCGVDYTSGSSINADWATATKIFTPPADGKPVPLTAFTLSVNGAVGFKIEGAYSWS